MPDIENRTHESTVKIMTEEDLRKPVLGVKYPSELMYLNKFDIISGMVPDYMHCCLEGVGEQVLNYLLDLMDSSDVKELDEMIKNFSVPNLIAKAAKLLSKKDEWKARDKENFDLYYSLAIFKNKLSEDKYKYWKLFAESLYTLLKDNISYEEVDTADAQLHEFVVLTQKNCGTSKMTFNVHQLLHISQSVSDWGPLWAHSCFPFESANYKILQIIKCSKGVPQQVVRFVNMSHSESILKESVYKHASFAVKQFCDEILGCKLKKVYTIGNNTYCGNMNELEEEMCVHLKLPVLTTKKFSKLIKDGCLYESRKDTSLKSDNSFVQFRYGTFAQINYFIVDTESNAEIIVCHKVNLKNPHEKSVMKEVASVDSDYTCEYTSMIDRICVFVPTRKNDKNIIPVPNTLHY